MFFGIVISVSVVGAIVLAIGLFLQRGREGVDLSPRSLLSAYLYVASLAAVIVTAGGLAALLTFSLGSAFGRDPIYGRGLVTELQRITEAHLSRKANARRSAPYSTGSAMTAKMESLKSLRRPATGATRLS